MRNFFLALLAGSCVLLSACNDSDDNNNSTSNPQPPKPSCKMHCAP
ncbi:hypothetical protein [Acinetobacter proteolyticus]|nr:hypothetical protein [Acinetobacter proteolyticus]